MVTTGLDISLCDTCLQRADYAKFLMSKGDSTVMEVLMYVDPPECQQNPICRWKGKWVSDAVSRVNEAGYQDPGPKEEQEPLPKYKPTKKELLKDIKLNHDNLTNELLVKSLILKEDISEGMKQLDKMEDMMDVLEIQVGREKVKTFPLAGEAEVTIKTQDSLEQGEEKYVTNGNCMPICPVAGEAEKHKTSVQALEQGEEKNCTEGLLNDNCMTICPVAGEAEEHKTSVQALEQVEEEKEVKTSVLDPEQGEEKQVSPADIKSGIGDLEQEERWLEQIATQLELDLQKGKDVSTYKLTEAGEDDIQLCVKNLDRTKDLLEEERWLDEIIWRLGINPDKWSLENDNSLTIGLQAGGAQEGNRTSVITQKQGEEKQTPPGLLIGNS